MKICFPIADNQGMESEVYGHFGSAPFFAVVDTESREIKLLSNADEHHAHGHCQPLKAIGGQSVEAVVVAGIGGGALKGLNQAGLTVYRAQGQTIADNISCFAMNELTVLTPGQTCGGHTHGQGTKAGSCQH